MDGTAPAPGVAALGERHLLQGYPTAGAVLLAAETPEEVRQAWAQLPPEVGVVILTPAAAAALRDAPADLSGALTVVIP